MQVPKDNSTAVGTRPAVDEEKSTSIGISTSPDETDDDPSSPYNWPSRRKITIGIICSTSQLVTTMAASMIAPALQDITRDLGVDATTGQIIFSIFFLGVGFAPMFTASLSETYGRRPVWLVGNACFILWNSLCPVGNSTAMMVVGRLMSASGASVGVTLTAPVLADMYHAKDRGKSLAIAGLLPYLGTALGPVIGGLAAQHLEWPWLFWILSFLDAACLILGWFLLEETYSTVLKARHTKQCAEGTRPKKASLFKRLAPGFVLPFRYLLLRPVVTLAAFAAAVNFGSYTLVLSIYASLWINQYHQSQTTASLHYIAISIGTILGAQLGGPLMDFIWRRQMAQVKNKDETASAMPEFRVPYMLVSAVPTSLFLFLYAWAGHLRWHWIIVDLSAGFFSMAEFMFFQGVLAYLVDEFGSKRAASSGAAMRLPSYIIGFAFPIFAPRLEQVLGYGVGLSIVAVIVSVVFALSIAALWFYGERLRAVGRWEDDT